MNKSLWDHTYYIAMLSTVSMVIFSVLPFFDGESETVSLVVLVFTVGFFGLSIFCSTMIGLSWPRWKIAWYALNIAVLAVMVWAVTEYVSCTGQDCSQTAMMYEAGSVVILFIMWLCYLFARFSQWYKSLRILYATVSHIAIVTALYLLATKTMA